MQRIGYMIYETAEGEKNRGFVSMFAQAVKAYGLRFCLVTKDQYKTSPLPDFVINRTRDPEVSLFYECHGVLVFHSSDIVHTGNDKAVTLQKLKQKWSAKIPLQIPKSTVIDLTQYAVGPADMTQVSIETQKKNAFIKLKKEVLKWQDKCGLMGHNVVLKSVGGHGGSEVFLVSMEEWDEEEKTQEKLQPLLNRKLLCQEWIDSDSRDIRIYVIGGQPYAAVLRQGFGDFRSNYSLGGSVREYSLDNMTKELVRQYIMALGGSALAFVGVDFLLEKSGCMVFNELEEMVGCRMLYACSDHDIVSDYVGWLAKKL